MNSALINLLVFGVLVLVSWTIFIESLAPKTCFRIAKQKKTITEDILKQLYHVEESKTNASLSSLAGALQIKKRILPIIEDMTNSLFVELENNNIRLTEDGEEYGIEDHSSS